MNLDQMLSALAKKLLFFFQIKKKHCWLFLWSILIGIVAHGYMFTNMLLNHDEILYGNDISYLNPIGLGRFLLLPVVNSLFMNYRMPFMIGAVAVLILSCICISLISFLDIKSKVLSFLAMLLIITFPSLTSTFCYYVLSVPYLIGLLLVVLGCVLIRKGSIGSMMLGMLFIVFSLSLYQAYIGFGVGILFIWLFIAVLQDKGPSIWGPVIIKWCICLIISFIIYLISAKVILHLSNSELSAYQAVNQLNVKTLILALPKNILNAYRQCILWFFNADYTTSIKYASPLIITCHIMIFVYTFSIILKNWPDLCLKNKLLLSMLIILSPGAMEAVHILFNANNVHMVMRMGAVLWYVLAIKIWDDFGFNVQVLTLKTKVWVTACSIAFGGVAFHNYRIANEAYYREQLAYERAYSQAVRITCRLEEMEGFSPDSKVFINDTLFNSTYFSDDDRFANINKLTGVGTAANICSSYVHIQRFFQQYMNITYELPTIDECRKIVRSKDFTNMPLYPQKDSIKVIDGIFVIKINTWGTLSIWEEKP